MLNKLLFTALFTLAHLAGSWCLGAEPPTVQDLVVVYNTGGLGPNPYLKDGYKAFFERAESHDFILLHNLIYRKPMQLAQTSLIEANHAGEPISDFKALAKYGRKRGKWWGVYLGSPETFKLLPGETNWRWLSRFIDEIRPIIDARPDLIVFDAFQEIDQIRYQMLAAKLRSTYRIGLGCEPCCYQDQEAMYDWAIAVQTEFINSRAGSNGWDTGKNAKRPLRYPGKHPLVIELVRSSRVKEDIEAARARGFVPGVNIGPLKAYLKSEGVK